MGWEVSPEWRKVYNQKVRKRAAAAQYLSLQPRDWPAASEAGTQRPSSPGASTEAARMVSENRVAQLGGLAPTSPASQQ